MCVIDDQVRSWSPFVTLLSGREKICEKARSSVLFYLRNFLFLTLSHIYQLAIAE